MDVAVRVAVGVRVEERDDVPVRVVEPVREDVRELEEVAVAVAVLVCVPVRDEVSAEERDADVVRVLVREPVADAVLDCVVVLDAVRVAVGVLDDVRELEGDRDAVRLRVPVLVGVEGEAVDDADELLVLVAVSVLCLAFTAYTLLSPPPPIYTVPSAAMAGEL